MKKVLNLLPEADEFDQDIVMHINSVLSILNDLGIGPVEGFMIFDADAVWDDFLIDGYIPYNMVKSYVFVKVKLMFDPPASGFAITALEHQAMEMEVRLSIKRENREWKAPVSVELGEVV